MRMIFLNSSRILLKELLRVSPVVVIMSPVLIAPGPDVPGPDAPVLMSLVLILSTP